MTRCLLPAWALAAGALLGLGNFSGADEVAPDPVRIGMSKSLFVDTAKNQVNLMIKRFQELMKDLTGLNGKVDIGEDNFAIAKKLDDKALDLGVFQGFEFAWAQEKHPKLRPLMIAIYHDPRLKAHVLVHAENPAADLAGIKGKDFALPWGGRGHCKLFVDRNCGDRGAEAFFGKITQPDNIEAAMDEVVFQMATATVVDNVSWEWYQRVKPAWAKKLKVLAESGVFPPAVIAYREGALSKNTLDRFKKGMLNATKSSWGREMMGLFKITAFEELPAELPKMVSYVLKSFPAPKSP